MHTNLPQATTQNKSNVCQRGLQPPSRGSSHVTAACFCHVTSNQLRSSASAGSAVVCFTTKRTVPPPSLAATRPEDPGGPGERPRCRQASTSVSLRYFARVDRTSRSLRLPAGRPQRSKRRLGGSDSATGAAWARSAADLRSARGRERGRQPAGSHCLTG